MSSVITLGPQSLALLSAYQAYKGNTTTPNDSQKQQQRPPSPPPTAIGGFGRASTAMISATQHVPIALDDPTNPQLANQILPGSSPKPINISENSLAKTDQLRASLGLEPLENTNDLNEYVYPKGNPVTESETQLSRTNALRESQGLPPLESTVPVNEIKYSTEKPIQISDTELAKTDQLRQSQGLEPLEKIANLDVIHYGKPTQTVEPSALMFVGPNIKSPDEVVKMFHQNEIYNGPLKNGQPDTETFPVNEINPFGELLKGLQGGGYNILNIPRSIIDQNTPIHPVGSDLWISTLINNLSSGKSVLDSIRSAGTATASLASTRPEYEIGAEIPGALFTVATAGVGKTTGFVKDILNARAVKSFITANLRDIPKNIRVEEAIAKTTSKITDINKQIENINTQLVNKVNSPLSERILGTTQATKESLVQETQPLIEQRTKLETLANQLTQVKGNLENLAKISPGEIVAKVKTPVIEKTEKIGEGVYGLYFNDVGSKFAGALLSLGKKGASTFIPILKTVPEGTKAVPSAELMGGVRGVIRVSLEKNKNLSISDQIQKASEDVNKFLKNKNLAYEVTYPKEVEPVAFANLGSFNERVSYLAKSLTPRPTVYAIGKEIPSSKITEIINERKSPDLFSKILIGQEDSNILEQIKTGDIHFVKTNIEHIIDNLDLLKEPLETKDFTFGLGIKVKEGLRGFNYLASRFSSKGNDIIKNYSAKAKKVELPNLEPAKTGAGSSGRAKSYAKAIQAESDKNILEQLMKETDVTKPLTKQEKEALLRATGSRYGSKPIEIPTVTGPTIVTGEKSSRRTQRNNGYTTEFVTIRYPPGTSHKNLLNRISSERVGDTVSKIRFNQLEKITPDIKTISINVSEILNKIKENTQGKINTDLASKLVMVEIPDISSKTGTSLVVIPMQSIKNVPINTTLTIPVTTPRTIERIRIPELGGGSIPLIYLSGIPGGKKKKGYFKSSVFIYNVNPYLPGAIAQEGVAGKTVGTSSEIFKEVEVKFPDTGINLNKKGKKTKKYF